MSTAPPSFDALLIVDPQVDFCPGGALPVPQGDRIFPALNHASREVPLVVASRDWHPADHCSYFNRGGIWPVHCQADTPGADFHPALDISAIDHVVSKGTEPEVEAYSAFDGTGLADWLREHQVHRLLVGGLATDYCVRSSVLDARRQGFEVGVLADAVGAVDVKPGDGERALTELVAAGAHLVKSDELA
ncbi:MAG: nicotinamidase [Candidatus Dormibacteraeota bacterium]|nr:nicotinamidase [Candidatus Dormibacteraeota bacterium]